MWYVLPDSNKQYPLAIETVKNQITEPPGHQAGRIGNRRSDHRASPKVEPEYCRPGGSDQSKAWKKQPAREETRKKTTTGAAADNRAAEGNKEVDSSA